MEKGTLVEFRLQGDRRLGVVDRPDGKTRWFVVDERGQSHSLAPRQITYIVTGQTYKSSQIASFLEEVKPYLDPSSLEVAWELLVEDGEAVTPQVMASLLFSESQPPQCYAAYWLLSEDKIYFKQKGDSYEPRTAAQVAERKHQIEIEALKAKGQQEFLARVEQALKGEAVEWQRHDRHRLEALEKYAALLADIVRVGLNYDSLARAYPPPAPVLETMNMLGRSATPQGALQLLVDLGWWSPHENLFLRRSSIPVQFPTKVLEVSQQRLQSPPPDPDVNRLDLTYLKVYTIDDESTTEIDDGLSWEQLPDGRERLWVHIADPTRFLMPEDELDLEARKRGSTVYLPTGMVPMFPEILATGPMSLVQGQVCCALSFGIILDASGAVENYSIHASLIKPTYRLTYEDVDEMLDLDVQAEPEIAAIARWANKRKAWRYAQGAISINMPEAMIKVKEDDIKIYVLDDSPSRQLVAEMMILAGEVAARYGQTHQIPLPFRGQPQPELPPEQELLQLPAGFVRACAMRRCMPKSEMSITPVRHAGLGLDTYTQATSPIRRYSDLLTHFQLKAHLRGDVPPFSAEQLKEVMMTVSTITQEVTMVERQTNRYWALEYLRRCTDKVWQATVLMWLREDSGLALILLEDLGLQLPMSFRRPLKLGEQVLVKVSHADPQKDVIQFQEVIYQEA
ncbi:ribonuclease catalytic domain-containing protein [Fischerella thermalis]|uniref:Exoribonuclease II n=1 Tax=Fischerella thermalis JSC-11 TaxID=741277 RepID=G6FML9_9CYAN|nr:ribonuclease R family protein [Fischerella thermalis]PMB04844.1 RNB domain-containing ribonuclease [Fischerella thermalis CCMEE 5328]PMB08221.1 RNB domain-containing ribonuclease [Fischerella thermalis CCMEE 5273]EHC19299.1 Exoribonuclease II [Fischerella thermalis JSC-11]MBF1989715.1 VacB/RNase II family 3'-5' exoribonuclease [Fischerella thermalis M58_A2018_009]MBF2059294.1 VacB/RNase II family 3'-5' exoribonuclease [Fischerella thermalis M66_A2018_004]